MENEKTIYEMNKEMGSLDGRQKMANILAAVVAVALIAVFLYFITRNV